MRSLSIAVVGAGIGGLTAALALARQGHRITLVERRTGFSEVGAGLQISPNASRVLIGLGLGSALRRVASEPERVAIRSIRSGAAIGEVALGRSMQEWFGAPYWVVHRADLQRVLLDAVRGSSDTRLVMGRTVEALATGPGGTRLRLASSAGAREILEADLAVGADGLWSVVRKALGDGRKPRFRHSVAWRATVEREKAPSDFQGDETGLWLGVQMHVVHYPIDQGRRINIVAIGRRAHPAEGWSTPDDGAQLRSKLASAAVPLRDLVALPKQWLLWSLFDLPARKMAADQVALLGDAAHPVLPFLAQGAALAIEDAATLSHALARSGSDPAQALAAYEAQRLRRARRVQRDARFNGFAYHAGGPAAFVRNRVMRSLGPEGMAQHYAWLYGWRPPGM